MSGRCVVLSLLMGLLLPLDALALGKCERIVVTGNPDSPPYLWRDPRKPKQLLGATADLLRQIGSEIGVRMELLAAPSNAKALEAFNTGRVDLFAGSFLTLEQLGQADFVHPPMYRTSTRVWINRGKGFAYAGLDDLFGRRGETPRNELLDADFAALANQALKLSSVATASKAFQQLLSGHVDYVLLDFYPGLALAAQMGVDQRLEPVGPAVSSAGIHLALSHNSSCNDPWLRGQLSRKMTELVAAKVPQALLQRNLEYWQRQQAPARQSESTGKKPFMLATFCAWPVAGCVNDPAPYIDSQMAKMKLAQDKLVPAEKSMAEQNY